MVPSGGWSGSAWEGFLPHPSSSHPHLHHCHPPPQPPLVPFTVVGQGQAPTRGCLRGAWSHAGLSPALAAGLFVFPLPAT